MHLPTHHSVRRYPASYYCATALKDSRVEKPPLHKKIVAFLISEGSVKMRYMILTRTEEREGVEVWNYAAD